MIASVLPGRNKNCYKINIINSMKKSILLFGLSMLMTACVENQETINPVLNVEGGQIQGVKLDTSDVIVYRGVPYAAPPVGDLRWKRPEPVVAWEGVKLADKFSDGAMQRIRDPKDGQYGTEFHFRSDDPNYSEDCLYLNVWAPSYAPGHADKKLPVAMWIHGGAYVGGWGFEMQMDGEAWAKRDFGDYQLSPWCLWFHESARAVG